MNSASHRLAREVGSSFQLVPRAAEVIRGAAVDGLKALRDRGVEIGGLLTGRSVEPSGLVVEDVEFILCEHRFGPSYRLSENDFVNFSRTAEELHSNRRQVIGCFRSSIGQRDDFDDADQEMIGSVAGCRVFLIVKPFSDRHCSVRVFQPDRTGAWSQSDEFAISFSNQFAPAPRPVTPPERAEAAVPVAVSTPAAPALRNPAPPPAPPAVEAAVPAGIPDVAPPPKRRLTWLLVTVLLVALAAGATLGRLSKVADLSQLSNIRDWLPGIAAHIAALVPKQTSALPRELGLKVEPTGSSLRVTWNYNSAAVQSATGGTLHIEDGPERRDVHLDAGQISNGFILYSPGSDKVVFRMEIQPAAGAPVNESVLILDSLRPRERTNPEPVVVQPEVKNPVAAQEKQSSIPPVMPAEKSPERPRQFDVSSLGSKQSSTPSTTAPTADTPPPMVLLNEPLAATGTGIPLQSLAKPPAAPPASSPAPAATKPKPAPVMIPPRPIKASIPSGASLALPSGAHPATIDVAVQVAISAQGTVTSARTVNGSGNASVLMMAESLGAARLWGFEPARVNGRPTPTTYTIVFHFPASGRHRR